MLQERVVGLIVMVALGGAAGDLRAAPAATSVPAETKAKPKAAGPLPAATLTELRTQLTGTDPQAAIAAARKLGDSGASNAATPLTELLAMGTTPTLAVEALTALGKLRSPKAIQVLTLYAGNRNEPVRKAAVEALGVLADNRVAGVLIERLGDLAPEIRAAAAAALAARKDERAAPRLFKLVAKNDAGAAAPLGTLISPNDVPKLAELRGQIDDAVLATALGEFLKRPNVADRLRVDVVRTLGRIPGPGATTALVEYLASIPEKDTRPSKDEAQKTVDSRGVR
ncbi:MAG TPA: HEAT repeat domain-containing protein [Polyangia bacterium]